MCRGTRLAPARPAASKEHLHRPEQSILQRKDSHEDILAVVDPEPAFRGFCGDCGTPLTYEAPDGLAIAAGAFDDPAALPPTIQYGIEAKLPFTDQLHELPGIRTEDDAEAAEFINDIVSYQHPDHDTAVWPPEDKA